MQIVFICGSIEPGRDGVGDYTRRLAVELIKQGHNARIIALNDQNIKEVTSAIQSQDNIDIEVFRLPTALKGSIRFELAKKWIDDNNPDLLSLQFVPFAFHPKGLSLQLHRQLKNIGCGRKWHIMFHELWVGMAQDSNFRIVLWGKFQKLLIRRLINVIKPVTIHTQAKLYQVQLADLGVKAMYLPLFSNIPVSNVIREKMTDAVSLKEQQGKISLVLFGGIHPEAPIKQFVDEVALYAKINYIIPVLKIIGRYSAEQERWADLWRSTGLPLELLGEQSEQSVSEILSTSSLGISTTPFLLADKSSALATMRGHQLPVLCVSRPWYPRKKTSYEMTDGVIDYKAGNFNLVMKEKKSPFNHSISVISRQFVNSLM